MARYLIDTDVMFDVSRGSAEAATFVDSLEDITISNTTAHELIVGARSQRDASAIDDFVRTFRIMPICVQRLPGSRTICSGGILKLTGCGPSMP